jgi:hypothetical protein
MPQSGFYNDNEYRDYPFLTQGRPLEFVRTVVASGSSSSSSSPSSVSSEAGTPGLPHATIVDFGAIMSIGSGFLEEEHWVYLHSVRRQGSYLRFLFRDTKTDEWLVFHRHIHAAEFTSSWEASVPDPAEVPWPNESSSSLESSSPSSSSSSVAAPFALEECSEPQWEGFLVTGLLTEIVSLVNDGETIIFDYRIWVIEPTRVQSLYKSFVRTINLANRQRTLVTPADRCVPSSSSLSDTADQVWANQLCMQDHLEFKAGFNCTIRQEDVANAIVIDGTPGGGGDGVGQNCEDFRLYHGEAKPGGGDYYTGGPTCGDIVKTINGKGGRRLRIHAGPGFKISTDPTNQSRLIVDAALDDFALCFPEPSSSSSSSAPA